MTIGSTGSIARTSISMPTETKNRLASRSRSGRTSAWTWWLNSPSARISPPRNAPAAIDSPQHGRELRPCRRWPAAPTARTPRAKAPRPSRSSRGSSTRPRSSTPPPTMASSTQRRRRHCSSPGDAPPEQRRRRRQHRDDHDVLQQQDADRQPPVRRVERGCGAPAP